MATPPDLMRTLRLARARQTVGDLQGALALIDQVLAGHPQHLMANLMSALLLMQSDQIEQAMQRLHHALDCHPNDVSLLSTLATCLLAQDRTEEAVEQLQKALQIDPRDTNCRFNLGRGLLNLHRYAEAVQVYQVFVRQHPHDAEGYSDLGMAHMGQSASSRAEACFRQAIQIDGKNPFYYANLARALGHQGRPGDAASAYRMALRLNPDSLEVHTQHGWLQLMHGTLENAKLAFSQVLQKQPGHASATAGLASVYERRGDLDAAEATLAPHLDSTPPHYKIAICHALVSRQRDTPAAGLAVVRRALEPPMSRLRAAGLQFAEGQLLDALGEADAALDAFHQANQGLGLDFDAAAHSAWIDSVIATFTPELLARLPRSTLDSSNSVLVVGMPRSGTSLVEQILSTHPRIHGAGELDDVLRITEALHRVVPGGLPYPQCVTKLAAGLVDKLAQLRLERLRKISRANFVVDKMPMNFLHLGMVALLTPSARIIHCQRSPVDTCLSCVFQHFNGKRYAFTTSLEGLAAFYSDYQRLMDHWTKVLPLEVFPLKYEELVADPEAVSRELLSFVGVSWDRSVLDFHQSQRQVQTASYAQVRRPIYASSVGRAQRYAHRLGPLLALQD